MIAFDDLTALGVVRGLAEAGLRVPDDCSVMGFDDVLPAEVATPAMTTIRQPLKEMGLRGGGAGLYRRSSAAPEARRKPRLHKPCPELVVRMSTSCPPGKSKEPSRKYTAETDRRWQDKETRASIKRLNWSLWSETAQSALCKGGHLEDLQIDCHVADNVVRPLPPRSRAVHPLREGWRLQSACTVKAEGAAISVAGFPMDDWIKTTVPSTVLAAQAAAKLVPDPYYGMNLRKIPGTSYPDRPQLCESSHAAG